ncbi:tRNA (mnm(5)s(2)U34)-methyltransferase [Clostridium fallax]|uniref:Putative rRNA methylase n=1 Tax=Clostridium fallax TaxID=1533 RepID=A0A1M4XH46_9CLOT|nr:class I SAM-dependent methyltransferase [Clostridium fallax]SHE92721.1 Putative rRNA methylase [Clostridium fallax]SQB06399.1 rRNA methylase [Clostridium fallax]
MFNYVGDISKISHYIIDNFLVNKDIAVDCTLGNGHDTDFLKERFNKVYSFEIQKNAIDQYKENNKDSKVFLINDSHEFIDNYIKEPVDCIMYNLGFLPGADKNITTLKDSTIKSIKASLNLLRKGGIISIASYVGHEEGKKEYDEILNLLENLSKKDFGVLSHQFVNRNNNPPILFIVEKK